ncbi:MAG: hypothetical protein LBV23_00580 [Deltaproteobacteria bacterium]|jgi:hypothetical protein|nr:hypothetical protein [Deltaproteobacteria bacterium]
MCITGTIMEMLIGLTFDEAEAHPAVQEMHVKLVSVIADIDRMVNKYFPPEEEGKFTLVPPIKPEDTGGN